MTQLFVGNFDFESTLIVPSGAQNAARPGRIVAELAPVWIAAAEEGDILWCREPINSAFFAQLHQQGLPRVLPVSQTSDIPSGLNLVPWGWTDDVIRRGRSTGAVIDAPPLNAVREINSRRFSSRLELDWGVGLEGAAVAESLSGMFEAIDRLPSLGAGWVVKAEFSNSSRERFLHRGNRHWDRDTLARWAERRLAMGQALFVEPWVERVDEVGVQMTVRESGEHRVDGVSRLLVDGAGRYRGSEFTPTLDDDPDWQDAVAMALMAADAIQQTGYFGPLGIDAMRYRDAAGSLRLRPIQDVNARWTIGRLSLGLRRLLRSGERGYWLHSPHPTCSERKGMTNPDLQQRILSTSGIPHELGRQPQSPMTVREIVTSPDVIGGRPVRHFSAISMISSSDPLDPGCLKAAEAPAT
ncbi:MAG: hypothetical protein AB7U20_22370 [Planctomycetaceae bacterium]